MTRTITTPLPVLTGFRDTASLILFTPMIAKKSITILLPRGEAIRNFVYSGSMGKLARNADLDIFSVRTELNFKQLDLINVRLQPLIDYHEFRLVNFIREILDMAHGRWLWSKAAQERWRLRDAEATTLSAKAKRLVKKAVCRPFAFRPGLELLSGLERACSRMLKTTDEYLSYFAANRPALVFNASHVHSSNAIQPVQAAQWLGIPTAAFIFSWDNLTSQGRIIPPYDYYLVWNEQLKSQLLDIYRDIRPEQVLVTGTPQFDFHFQEKYYWSRAEFCAKVKADPARPIVLYTTGMANHMPGEPLIVEQIADQLQEMTGFGPPQLLVRVYAKDLTGRFNELKNRRKDILFPKVPWDAEWLTPKPEDIPLLTNTLRHSDLGINVASTISLELCMFDKPVINVGYNPPNVAKDEVDYSRYYQFDHYRPVVESGAVQVAWSITEMRQRIRGALAMPEEYSKNRSSFLLEMFGNTLDGHSGRRIAETLTYLANRTNR